MKVKTFQTTMLRKRLKPLCHITNDQSIFQQKETGSFSTLVPLSVGRIAHVPIYYLSLYCFFFFFQDMKEHLLKTVLLLWLVIHLCCSLNSYDPILMGEY